MIDDIGIRERVKSAFWETLDERGVSYSEVSRILGKPRGWLYNQTRRKGIDLADFWLICRVVGIDPIEFLQRVLPPDSEVDPLETEILERARRAWAKRKKV